MLEQRIDEKAFIGLIRKWLKAGVFLPEGRVEQPATGTPQGGIVSPVLANIYLHFVLDFALVKSNSYYLMNVSLRFHRGSD